MEVLVQFDLLRSQDHDLTSEELWDKIFGMLSEGGWILLASPPCETFTRVRHQRPGPPPLRSSAFPFGFPWLRNSDADKVRTANYFISQTLSACGIAAQAGGAYFIEHPEDLGVTSSKEVPASIWQWPEVRDLQVQTHAITFAIFQCIYEAPTSKPTRFLTTLRAFLDAPLHLLHGLDLIHKAGTLDRCLPGAPTASIRKLWSVALDMSGQQRAPQL